RNFVPVPDHARAVLAGISPVDGPLLDVVTRELRRLTGVTVPYDAWQLDRVPDYLKMTFRVEDERGRPLAEGKDLAELKRRLAREARAAVSTVVSDVVDGIERQGLADWTVGTLPPVVQRKHAGYGVRAYPALTDAGDSLAGRGIETQDYR